MSSPKLGKFKHKSGTEYLRHDCCVCGDRHAPFGTGVDLKMASLMRDKKLLGKWYCRKHWKEMFDGK